MNQDKIMIVCAGAPNPALHKIAKIKASEDQLFFIGVDRGALKLVDRGYIVDIAIGDFDSVSAPEMKRIKENSREVYELPTEKDLTDTEIAFSWISEHYPNSQIYVFGSLGEGQGRLDHLVSNLFMIYRPELTDLLYHTNMIEGHTEIAWYNKGQHTIEVGNVLPDYVSIITMTQVKGLSIQDARYQLDKRDFSYPMALISNEFIDLNTNIQLSITEGSVMVMKVNESDKEL